MGIVRGLTNIQKAAESRGGNASWLRLKDGDSVKLRFLQELDESADNYNEEAGLGFLVLMHRHPVNFKRRAVCTADEGACYGCEQGWNQRQELFLNVAVEEETGESVKILNQAVGKSSIVSWLLEYAGDAGSITDLPFRMKRTGSGKTDTQYTLTPAGKALDPIDYSQYELIDLEKSLAQVPYEQQEDFYEENDSESEEEAKDEVW